MGKTKAVSTGTTSIRQHKLLVKRALRALEKLGITSSELNAAEWAMQMEKDRLDPDSNDNEVLSWKDTFDNERDAQLEDSRDFIIDTYELVSDQAIKLGLAAPSDW